MEQIIKKINDLKKQKDVVILAHYYVEPQVKKIADYVGDSYYLSKIATEVSQQTIVLCGVKFMGESVKILNPTKTVIMPDKDADCPMAHMATATKIKAVRAQYKDLAVVCYINSTAEIKALSDVCVTSSNAEQIVGTLPNKNIFFIPDKNLGSYIAKKFPEKSFIINEGYCHVHEEIKRSDVINLQEQYKEAKILAHPECSMEVVEIADYVGSTSGIIDFATKDPAQTFIICTEEGIAFELKEKNPQKTFLFPEKTPLCKDMKKITLDKLLEALENMEGKIEIGEELRKRAENSLIKMHEIAK